nr:unnamed protein product [Spirometra erinaceieuropaei]
MDAYRDECSEIHVAYRTDGYLLNQPRMHLQSRVSTTTVHEILSADDCAPNATTERNIQRSMDLFINTEKTVVMHQPPPNAAYNVPLINVNVAHLESSSSPPQHQAQDV